MEVVVIILRASLSVRFLDQPGPLARPGSLPTVACSWRRPIALPMVHHSAEPSGLPVTFGAVADAYLVPRSFSLGSRGTSPVPMQPFATCCHQCPAGSRHGHQPVSVVIEYCLPRRPSGSASGCNL